MHHCLSCQTTHHGAVADRRSSKRRARRGRGMETALVSPINYPSTKKKLLFFVMGSSSTHHLISTATAAAVHWSLTTSSLPIQESRLRRNKHYYWYNGDFSIGDNSKGDWVLEDLEHFTSRSSLQLLSGEERKKTLESRHRHHLDSNRDTFLKSLLQIRGGEEEDGYLTEHLEDIQDDLSAEDLLDSLFGMDEVNDVLPPMPDTAEGSKSSPESHTPATPSSLNASKQPTLSANSMKSKDMKWKNINDGAISDADDKGSKQSVRRKTTAATTTTATTNEKSSSMFIRKDADDINSIDLDGAGARMQANLSFMQVDFPDEIEHSNKPNEIHSKWHKVDSDMQDNVHAVWGPNAQHPKKHPGPPPAKATSDERRKDQHRKRSQDQHNRLFTKLAMSLHDSHVSAVQSLIKGSAAHVPPELFGQSIMQERSACNEMFRDVLLEDAKRRREMNLWMKAEIAKSTVLNRGRQQHHDKGEGSSGIDDPVLSSTEPSFRHIEDPALLSYWGLTPNARLYGGAQYHRVLRYYHHLFLTVTLPPITQDEVALLTNGITEVHDASDLLRAVALLVRQKMETVMEDVLADMTRRLLYVMDRQWEMVDYSMSLHRPMGGGANTGLGSSGFERVAKEADLYQKHGAEYTSAVSDLKNVLAAGFHKFAEERAAEAHDKSLEDVRSLLRYVTWDMGRARESSRVVGDQGRGRNQEGFVSQVEIVSGESSAESGHAESNNGQVEDDSRRTKKSNGSKSKKKKKKKHKNDENAMSDHSNKRMVARGGDDSMRGKRMNESHNGRWKLRNKAGGAMYDEREEREEDMGDLIGGVMNRGQLDSEYDGDVGGGNPSASMAVSSKESPMFSGDDQVLNVLLDTVVASTDVSRSETTTQAAIESLVSYVTDRMRMDLSRIVRSKFNTFFLLAFYEELGPYLRKELDAYLVTHRLDG